MHLYFALAALAGLAWFGTGVRTLAVRHVHVGGYVRQGVAAFMLGAFTMLAGGLVFNYGLINLLSPPPELHKSLLLMILFVGLIQGTGLALAEAVYLIARRFRRERE